MTEVPHAPATSSATSPPVYLKLVPCSFHPFDNGQAENEEFLVRMASGRQFRVSGLVKRILERLDGETTLEEVAASLRADQVPISSEQLGALLEQRYRPLGLIGKVGDMPAEQAGTEAERPAAATSGLPFLLTARIMPKRWVVPVASFLSPLYSKPALFFTLPAILLAHIAVYGGAMTAAAPSPEGYLAILAMLLASMFVHELGHAAAVSRFGGTPGPIGVGLYLLMPTFFADVSQVWAFRRKQRVVVDVGGAYFQQLVFVAFAVLAWTTGRPEPLAVCHLIDLLILIGLNPLFRFDGYWILVDYLGIPKLQSVALGFTGNRLKRLFRPATPKLPAPALGRLPGLVFRGYAALSALFLVAILTIAYRYLHTVFTRYPKAIPEALEALRIAFADGDPLAIANRAVILFFLVALPLTVAAGMTLYLRRLAQSAWQRLRPGTTPQTRPSLSRTDQPPAPSVPTSEGARHENHTRSPAA